MTGPNRCSAQHPPTDTCTAGCRCVQILSQVGLTVDMHPGSEHVNTFCGTVWPLYPTTPGMVMRYSGPATLQRPGGTRLASITAELVVNDAGGVRTWGGTATTTDLAVLSLDKRSAVLTLPDGRTGEVWIPNAQVEPGTPGVVVRLHGAGPTPPWATTPH